LATSIKQSTSPVPYEKSERLSRWGRWQVRFRKDRPLILMAAPGLILLLIFSYLPMAGLILAFKDYRFDKGIFGSDWVGLSNFRFLFETSDAWRAISNTLYMNFMFITTNLIVSIGLALLLNEIQRSILSRFYQSILFFPYFMSWVIVGYLVFAFLSPENGLINHLLRDFELTPVRWYSTPQPWRLILIIVNSWKNIGFWCIVYLAGMLSISPEYYEAAQIDGANRLKQITSITLPLITPLIIINVLLSVGRIMYADFGLFYNVTRNSALLYSTTEVLDTYVFRALRVMGDIGMSSAAGLFQAVIGFALVLGANWIVRRIDPEKALF
jgi:putative aldouronate transport system permease protein